VKSLTIKTDEVRSICWLGDNLIDWASGRMYTATGELIQKVIYRIAYKFDAAICSHDGTYALLYERLGTKGLLLKEGKLLWEINRSFYHADAYEYPPRLHPRAPGDRRLPAADSLRGATGAS
jgi:hypothetical protein